MTTRTLRIIFSYLCTFAVAASSTQAAELVKVTGDRVNVRAKATTGSEVITQLGKGESVVFVEEMGAGPDELRWAKIQLPDNTPVWTSAEFINPADKTVIPQRLNVRSGPGANFNIVGQLIRGEKVNEIRTVQGWMEIAAPQGSHAFLAAKYLSNYDSAKKVTAPKATVTEKKVAPKPSELVVAPVMRADDSSLPIPSAIRPKAPATTELTTGSAIIEPSAPVLAAPAAPKLVEPTIEPPVTTDPPTLVEPEEPKMAKVDPPAPVEPEPVTKMPEPGPSVVVATEPSPTVPAMPEVEAPVVTAVPDLPESGEFDDPAFTRRVVTRLGIVRRAFSIQSPTSYKLIDPRSKRFMNYLYSSDKGLELKYYSGKTIQVTGEEYIDKRWPTRPLIEIRTMKPLAE